MDNLVVDDTPREFFVWVNPDDPIVRHQVTTIGCFLSTPGGPGQPAMMFLPNPDFRTFISPFQNNLLRNYMAEYNLELSRSAHFPEYPSRMHATFLLESRSEPERYAEAHPGHVDGRVLIQAETNGPYRYSVHDASWIDFMRLPSSLEAETVDVVAAAYWNGGSAADTPLLSMGQAWSQARSAEVLFEGRIDFPDRALPANNDNNLTARSYSDLAAPAPRVMPHTLGTEEGS